MRGKFIRHEKPLQSVPSLPARPIQKEDVLGQPDIGLRDWPQRSYDGCKKIGGYGHLV
jgi:hypothetical protein